MRGTVPGDCASATGTAARSRPSAMLVSQMLDALRAALRLGYERVTERRREPFKWSSPLHVSLVYPTCDSPELGSAHLDPSEVSQTVHESVEKRIGHDVRRPENYYSEWLPQRLGSSGAEGTGEQEKDDGRGKPGSEKPHYRASRTRNST